MNTIKRLVKNTGAAFLAHVVAPACSFILVLFVARSLGVSGLGNFSTALSLFFIFQTISSLGFTHFITREVARDRSKAGKYLINASFVGFFFSALMAGAMCLTGYLLNYSTDTTLAIYVLSFSLIPGALALICESICRAFEKLEYVSIPLITGDLFKVVLGLVILFKGYGLVELMTVILGSNLLIFFLSLYFVLRFIGTPVYRIDLSFCKSIIKATPVFALIFIFSTIYWNVDVVMLSKIKGPIEVGFYSAAYKLMNVCKIIPMAYLMAFQPVIFRLFKTSSEKFKMACTKSIKYLFFTILPIGVGTTVLADRFVQLFFRNEFLASANALRILIWTLVPFSTVLVFAYALIASNNQRIDLRVNIVGMLCNVGLNLLLIPKLGFLGASVATFVSICIFLILQYGFISRNLFRVNFVEATGRPLISGALMGIVILLLRPVNLLLLIFISASVYALLLVALGTFSKSDIHILRRLWEKESGLGLSQSQSSSGYRPSSQ